MFWTDQVIDLKEYLWCFDVPLNWPSGYSIDMSRPTQQITNELAPVELHTSSVDGSSRYMKDYW